ncbi:MAG: TlpA family protein disulfide reductase [Chitinophagaceae bacterium]|nr:MAG: TlpA family protein disulfide reductase [Chitinophagaceae bacterium]
MPSKILFSFINGLKCINCSMILCEMKSVLLICIIACWALMPLYSCNDQKKKPGEVLHNKISSISLVNLKGEKINTSQFAGKTIFINFWATWCKPCLEEMPSIQKAMELLKNEDIEFLFASEEDVEQIDAFKSEQGYNFNYVRVENLAELNIIALPTTFIFNPGGKLVFSEMGYKKWDEKINIDLILNLAKSK